MEKAENSPAGAVPEVLEQTQAERVTRPSAGLQIDAAKELQATDDSTRLSVRDAVARRSGPRLPRSRKPPPAPALDIPAGCKGAGCLTRMELARIAEKCRGDKECRRKETLEYLEARRN